MVLNRKPTGRAISMPKGLAIGMAISVGITLLGSAVIAKLIDGEYAKEGWMGYGVMIVLMIGSFLGAVVAAGKIKRQRLCVCALSGLLHFAMLMSITALFFGGQYEAVGVTAVLVMGGALLAALVGGRPGRGGKRKKYKMANR